MRKCEIDLQPTGLLVFLMLVTTYITGFAHVPFPEKFSQRHLESVIRVKFLSRELPKSLFVRYKQ